MIKRFVVASQSSFRIVAILPVLLLVVFGITWNYDKVKGVQFEVLEEQDAEA